MAKQFSGKVVLVTGAGHGIGKDVARSYADAGASVVVTDLNGGWAERSAAEITASGGSCISIPMDVRKESEVCSAMERIAAQYGSLDIIVNNAGVSRLGTTHPCELAVQEFDDILAVNLRGPFLVAKYGAKLMSAHGRGGSIVNIASTRALMAEPWQEAYGASKGGLLALTHSLAVSLGPDKITVNSICPGWIDTAQGFLELTPAAHGQHITGRIGRTEDVARACMYFTAPGNDFVTGTNLVVDGGMTKKMIYVS